MNSGAKRKARPNRCPGRHSALVALVRKKTDEAVADFQKGIDANPDPVLMIRTGRALLAAKKPDEAITYFDKVMNSADAPAQIKSIAQADRVRDPARRNGTWRRSK